MKSLPKFFFENLSIRIYYQKMEQAQITQITEKAKEIKNKEKTITITSNKNNLYEIKLINEIAYLLIKASNNNSLQALKF